MNRSRAVILGLAAIMGVIAALIVLPYLAYVLLAALLGYILRPLHNRLRKKTGEQLSAGILVLGASVAIIGPLAVAMWVVAENLITLVEGVRSGEITFERIEGPIEELTGVQLDLMSRLQSIIEGADVGVVGSAVSTFGLVAHVLIGLMLTIFLLYYILKDGERLGAWLRATVPIENRIFDQLYDEFDDVMSAVLYSHVLVAVVQGAIAGIGLFVVGIPEAVFWTLVMIFLSLLPIIGSFMVWGPASIYLVVTGQPIAGAFLLIYGTIVVGLTDDVLRPLVIERYSSSHINPGVIILGVLGGISLLGFMGIFLGPVLLGLFRSVLDVYRQEFVQDDAAPDPDDGSSAPGDDPGAASGAGAVD